MALSRPRRPEYQPRPALDRRVASRAMASRRRAVRASSRAGARRPHQPRPSFAAQARAPGRPLRVEARHRPHRVRHPPRVRGRAAQAPPVPGAGAHRGAHHRRLHRAGRRPVGPVGHPAPPVEGGGRRARRHLRRAGAAGSCCPTTSRSAATPSGSARWASRTCCGSPPRTTVARMLERDDFAKRYATARRSR